MKSNSPAATRIWPIKTFVALSAIFAGTLFFGTAAHAATIFSGQSVTISSSTSDNAYISGAQVSVYAPLPADLCIAGGTITVDAPVAGDELLAGGTIDVQKPVTGDARIVGGRVSVDDSVGGDLMVAGGAVSISGKAKDTRVAGVTVNMTNGSSGNVVIYAADATLAGDFNGDVEVVASDKLTVAEGTVIHGVLKYNAPDQADIPASARIDGGVNYIGSAAWLPTVKQAKTFATAGLFVFFLVRIMAVIVAAGLVAGLFPKLTDRVVEATLRRTPERFILMALLGFAGFVVTPVLILLLLVSFVGIGVALLILALYLLFLLLAYLYSAALVGALCMYVIQKKTRVSWRVAILGVIVIFIIGSIPYVGFIVNAILSAAAGGALLALSYGFAFKREIIDIDNF
jgi:hypothetical protein